MKKFFGFILVIFAVVALVSCNTGKISVQGIDKDAKTVTVGNTAATSGGFSVVGVPFNAGIKAVFEYYNAQEGNEWTMILKHYDDGFDASMGTSYTEKLVEEDEIFALVGHFGTPTVGATIEYIQETGIPMVYAATGINDLYFEKTLGNPVMAVQPIYRTDGRIMAARALNEKLYGATSEAALPEGAKVALVYTNDDVGKSIREGVVQEFELAGKKGDLQEIVLDPEAANNAVTALAANTSAIIVGANQNPFKAFTSALNNTSSKVPVFTSYVNSDATAVDLEATYTFDMYTNAWVDLVSDAGAAALVKYVEIIGAASFLSEEEKTAYYGNSFAIAGYIAAQVFLEGFDRVADDKNITWKSFIKAMESAPIDIPMGSEVDFGEGNRIGIATMSLLKYNTVEHVFEPSRPMASLEDIKK